MRAIILSIFSLCLFISFNTYANNDDSVYCKDLKEGQEFDGTSEEVCMFINQSLLAVYRSIAKNDGYLTKNLDIMKNKTYKIDEEYSKVIITYKWKSPKHLILRKDMNDGNEVTTFTFNEGAKGTKLTTIIETQY